VQQGTQLESTAALTHVFLCCHCLCVSPGGQLRHVGVESDTRGSRKSRLARRPPLLSTRTLDRPLPPSRGCFLTFLQHRPTQAVLHRFVRGLRGSVPSLHCRCRRSRRGGRCGPPALFWLLTSFAAARPSLLPTPSITRSPPLISTPSFCLDLLPLHANAPLSSVPDLMPSQGAPVCDSVWNGLARRRWRISLCHPVHVRVHSSPCHGVRCLADCWRMQQRRGRGVQSWCWHCQREWKRPQQRQQKAGSGTQDSGLSYIAPDMACACMRLQ